MKVIEITQAGEAEVLQLAERPIPEPGPGQVLIKVAAAGVNRPDVMQRRGQYKPPPDASDLPGLEVSGEIVAGDPATSGFKIGQSVCALVHGGGYAEYCLAESGQCLPVPDGWPVEDAASLPETLFTVWSNVFERAHLAPGESLLVHGGSSGIGVTAIQIARALGHPVYVTAGSDEKCRACESLGATQAINYRSHEFEKEILALTDGRGVDVILEMVGGDYIARDIQCLADDGRIAIIGLMGGLTGEVSVAQILMRRLTLTGATLRPRSKAYKASIASALRERIWPRIAAGQIKPVIHARLPLEQAADAHRLMESSQHIGKILLTI